MAIERARNRRRRRREATTTRETRTKNIRARARVQRTLRRPRTRSAQTMGSFRPPLHAQTHTWRFSFSLTVFYIFFFGRAYDIIFIAAFCARANRTDGRTKPNRPTAGRRPSLNTKKIKQHIKTTENPFPFCSPSPPSQRAHFICRYLPI